MVLDRLEKGITDDCAPLIKVLSDICDDSTKKRAEPLLRKALASKNVGTVQAALHAIENLDLEDSLSTPIETCYRWWLLDGPQDPEGGGVVPESAAASLLSHLSARRRVSFEELCEAANSNRSDVREIAIKEICRFLEDEDALVECGPRQAGFCLGTKPLGLACGV